jgi:hypothetical protein
MIKVFEPSSGRVELLVTAVTTANLKSNRAIANFIGELRAEMAACPTMLRRSDRDIRGY